MSFMPNASPVFMYTNNADFTVAKNATSYLPSNLNSLYETSETSYSSSTNTLESDKCVCVFDFWGTGTDDNDTAMYHYLTNESSVQFFGRNTSVYVGMGGRLEDAVACTGTSIEPRFYRSSFSSVGTMTVQQYRAFLGGVSLK